MVKFPKLKLKDPYAKKGLPVWKKWLISISVLIVVAGGLWLGNLLAWAGAPSPFPFFNKDKVEVVEIVEMAEPAKDIPNDSVGEDI